jgi:hypothetical protein
MKRAAEPARRCATPQRRFRFQQNGTLRDRANAISQNETGCTTGAIGKAWKASLKAAKIHKRFTPHGRRYTFTDLVRRANVDVVVRRALTGHVTEEMQRHYSNASLDQKRAAVTGVIRLVPSAGVNAGGERGPKRLMADQRCIANRPSLLVLPGAG